MQKNKLEKNITIILVFFYNCHFLSFRFPFNITVKNCHTVKKNEKEKVMLKKADTCLPFLKGTFLGI